MLAEDSGTASDINSGVDKINVLSDVLNPAGAEALEERFAEWLAHLL